MEKYLGKFSSIKYHEVNKTLSGEIGVEFYYSNVTM
jgi:hypothetical protein